MEDGVLSIEAAGSRQNPPVKARKTHPGAPFFDFGRGCVLTNWQPRGN
jgi:hypothetical protein